MKKKKNLLIAGIAAALVVVVAVVLVIVFSGGRTPQESDQPLSNTWKVVKEVKGDAVKYPTNGFFVFTEDKATEYRDGEASAYVVSDYTYTPKEGAPGVLEMPAFSQIYAVEVFTSNYIRLYENDTDYKELIRYGNADRAVLNASEDSISGRWDVFFRGSGVNCREEWIVFATSLMMHNLDNNDASIADAFYWDANGCVCVDAINLKLKCYPLTDEIVMFVDVNTDTVWELHKTPPQPEYN